MINPVLSPDVTRAKRVADQLKAGRVAINGAPHEPFAPSGGFRQAGIGREFGLFGAEACFELRTVFT